MRQKTIVVLLFTLSVLFFLAQAFASDVTLAWDPVASSSLAGYKVYYGTASRSYGTPVNVGNKTSYVVTGLQAGTTYYFAVTAYDSSLNETTYSNEASAVTPQAVPVISNVQNTILTSNSATISWTTDLASDSEVNYGLNTNYGQTASNGSMVQSHTQSLSNLSASTLYHYRVRSKTSTGGQAASGDFSFTTLAPADTTPPIISGPSSSNITYSSAVITWTTNEGATSQVEYGTTTSYGSATNPDTTLVTAHNQVLSGLQASKTYHYRVVSRDGSGNTAASGDFSFTTPAAPDTTPPVISAVASANTTNSSATISWATNEGATSQVEYGTTSSYGSATNPDATLVTAHNQVLSGLQGGMTYYYRVISRDGAGNTATSGDFSFTTPVASDSTPPVISAVASSNITYSSAAITWTTNEGATSQVEYGTTTSYGSLTSLNSALYTAHNQGLGGLQGGKIYHYRVVSRDAAGNIAKSGDFTFKTARRNGRIK